MTDCNAGLSLNTVLPTTTGSSQPFTLNASDDYLLCVRAVRTTGTAPNELTLRSDWASAPSKPEPPARAHISNRTTSSLTLSWDEVVGLSFKVRIDGDAEFTPDTNGSHRFGGLVAGTPHDVEVSAQRVTLGSGWSSASGTTLTTRPPPGCPSPRPTQPHPEENQVTLSTSYKWVLRGTTAHEQVTTELRDDHRPYEWQAYPDCIWQLAADWVESTPYTDGPRDTGRQVEAEDER